MGQHNDDGYNLHNFHGIWKGYFRYVNEKGSMKRDENGLTIFVWIFFSRLLPEWTFFNGNGRMDGHMCFFLQGDYYISTNSVFYFKLLKNI